MLFRLRFLFLILAFSAGSAVSAMAQTEEAELKAAFIFTLAKYIEWPVDRLPEAGALRVCFASAASPLHSAMQPLVGRQVRGRVLEIRAGSTEPNCHVLVNPALPVKGSLTQGVLIISEREGAVDDGAHIEMFFDGGRVRFEANLAAARQAGLQLSAQLLKLARQIKNDK